MTKAAEPIYRIIFVQEDKIYEIYARYISEEPLMGFIEVEELLFGETVSSIVVDPSEEKLKAEFSDVSRTYIPMHSILRIDQVQKEGTAKIKSSESETKDNIRQFPGKFKQPLRDKE